MRARAPLLEVENLQVRFHTQDGVVKAVNGVDISVPAGSTLGIVGESGCGKSVTSLAILRLVAKPAGRITGGSVRLNGKELLELNDDAMRAVRGRDVAMIFQDPMTSLNPVLTVGEQIEEVLKTHFGMSTKQAERRAIELMSVVGIPAPERRVKDYPHQLSGGMRQRAMIAMAIACQPILLIADEPTTALDVTIQAQILDLMRDLVAEKQTALILITHDLGVVAGMCERTSVMYAGFIVEQAATLELFARPRHPYTLGLLSSIPRVDDVQGQRLTPIQGMPPDLTGDLNHCPFATRCRNVQDRCWNENPALEATGDEGDHAVACWYPIGEEGWREIGSEATSAITAEQAASRSSRTPEAIEHDGRRRAGRDRAGATRRRRGSPAARRGPQGPFPDTRRTADRATDRCRPRRRWGLLRRAAGRDLRPGGGVRLRQEHDRSRHHPAGGGHLAGASNSRAPTSPTSVGGLCASCAGGCRSSSRIPTRR